ncbi:unnamed protein product [Sphagnum tenellum]
MLFQKRNGFIEILPLLASASQRTGVLHALSCLVSEDTSQHEDKIAELLFDVALERVHSPSLNPLDEQCKCSQFQVECATFNQELQESQARQRWEQKWPNEEAVQTAQVWREEVERAHQLQREADSKLSATEASC